MSSRIKSIVVVYDDGSTHNVPVEPTAPIPTPTPIPTPAPTPTPPPPPVIVVTDPAADVVAEFGSDINAAFAKVKPGTAARPTTFGIERGGAWSSFPYMNKSYVTIFPVGKGPRPVINNTTISGGSNTTDVTLRGFDIVGNGTGNGVRLVTKAHRRLTLDDLTIKRGDAGIVIQCLDTHEPLANWMKDITIQNCRIYDGMGKGDREGHGIFLANVDGITIRNNHIDRAGWNKFAQDGTQTFKIYAHGIYGYAGLLRVLCEDNVFSRCESLGSQFRGPLLLPTDPNPTNDHGPVVRRNYYIDCAEALLVNGPEATVEDNVGQGGHYHNAGWNHGQVMFHAHIGTGLLRNNLMLLGPDPVKPQTRTDPMLVAPRFANPHGDDTWSYNLPTNPTNEGNLVVPTNRLKEMLAVADSIRTGQVTIADGRAALAVIAAAAKVGK